MKYINVLFSAFTFIHTAANCHAQAGGSVGHGGGTFVCKNGDIFPLDLNDAKILYHLTPDIPQPGDWKQITQGLINRLATVSPMRVELYSRWLKNFDFESEPLTSSKFSRTPDTENVITPDGCDFWQAIIQTHPRFPTQKRYLLNAKVWPRMKAPMKAMLALHEFVYREALSYHHPDSFASRYLTGLISSTKMSTLTRKSWLEALQQARFKLNDFYNPYITESNFDPKGMWLAGPDDGEILPIKIKHGLVSNIGICNSEDCSDYQAFSIDELDKVTNVKHFRICEGLIDLTVDQYHFTKFKMKADCSVYADIMLDNFGRYDFSNPSADLGDTMVRMRINRGSDLPRSTFNIEGLEGTSEPVEIKNCEIQGTNKKDIWTLEATQSFEIGHQGQIATFHNFSNYSFTLAKMSKNGYWVTPDVDESAPIPKPLRIGPELGFTITTNPKSYWSLSRILSPYDTIMLDRELPVTSNNDGKNLLNGIAVDQIYASGAVISWAFGRSTDGLTANDRNFIRIDWNRFTPNSRQIYVEREFSFCLSNDPDNYENDTNNFIAAAGNYELYDSGIIKKITALTKFRYRYGNNPLVDYPAGTTLEFDADGKVTHSEPPK